MKRLLVVVLLGVSILCSAAQPPQYRHSFSIGWGDMLFETLAFHPKPEENPFGYTGHFFAEYQYAFTRVVSACMRGSVQGFFGHRTMQAVRNSHRSLISISLARNSARGIGPELSNWVP